MLEQLDLDEIAEAYLSVRTPDRPEYERLLIRNREKAVFPLLRALLARAVKQKQWTDRIAQASKDSIFGEEVGRELWAKFTFEAEAKKVYDVIQRIGERAHTELGHALLEPDYKTRLAAALLLSMADSLNEETQRRIREALGYIGLESKQGIIPILIVLLGLVLARSGDTTWRILIENHARNDSLSFDDAERKIRNTALIELQRNK